MSSEARRSAAFASACAIAILAAGCGAASSSPPPDYARALRGAPAPLAELYGEANELLPGGTTAFEKRIAALHGYPVVVNVWASWCGNCIYEFPTLQRLSARYGKRVAFLGVDSEDSDDSAGSLLARDPVPYPSYTDPDKDLARQLGVRGFPDTAFFDRDGKLVWLREGPYRVEGELEAEIKKFALEAA